LLIAAVPTFSQADTLIAQLSNSSDDTFAGSMSGDGRFVVFESRGDIATVNPRNPDHNSEIFLLDYAQRRIFQITNTHSVFYDDKQILEIPSNVRVEITNIRPQISNDGKWIIFASNATSSRPSAPDSTNPGNFNGNSFTTPTPTPTPTVTPTPTPTASPTPTPGANILTQDGNMEMWMYQIPAYPAVSDLSQGDEIALTDLSGGTFTRLTNTDPSQLPRAGGPNNGPVVADDNHDATINDDGSYVAFVSNRDLVPGVGNAFPTDDNDEIYTYVRASATLQQVTKTPRGTVTSPIYNKNPSISGNGLRVAFASTGDNPVVGMAGGNNPSTSRNEEIFYADLNATGAPTLGKQVTTTTPTNTGDVVNILDYGRRMSRDGRYIGFDSTADLINNGANATGFACFVYDTSNSTFRQVGPRSDADTAATGGDVDHYPGFTDYNGSGVPQTLMLETRENIKADGTVAATVTDGLNQDATRPSQIYSYTLSQPAASATFTRLTKFPAMNFVIGQVQPLPSNTLTRSAFNLAQTELGTGNLDLLSEAYLLLKPTVTATATPTNSFATGATHLPINATPTPTPAATATPTPAPTASPTPTPVTEAAKLGVAPGMLVSLDYTATDAPIVARTGVGDLKRSPPLPVELSGVSMTINGAACGLKAVNGKHIDFTVPEALASQTDGSTNYPLIIFNNGTELKTTMTVVPARPDIFRIDNIAAPGGRTKALNVTNRVHTKEPFVIRTVKIKGGLFVPTILRVYVTGVDNNLTSNISVRIKNQTITGVTSSTEVEPGVWALDFPLPATALGIGDSPVVVTVTIGSASFVSRVDDTTSFVFIL
ncbi:MAG: PD40 domain-containing protein, partial [Acidobacteria bacterium]|nr:PD40 domain-containing protein [Acidobacteriota bacterium]